MTIASQLAHAGQLIGVTRANPEIQALVATRGYDERMLAEGQRLYEAAVQAVNTRAAKAGARRLATQQAGEAARIARAAHRDLLQSVRALFPLDSPERMALDVHGRSTLAIADFLAAATTLFDNALDLPEIGAKLALYGFDQPALLRGRDGVLAYRELLEKQANARSAALRATVNQTAALDELYCWTMQYTQFARIALRGRPDLLNALGIARRRATAAPRTTATP
jgi:hypothetical protein